MIAVFNPEAAEEPVVWKTSDMNVAAVSSTGKVTGLNAGFTLITVQSLDGTILLKGLKYKNFHQKCS